MDEIPLELFMKIVVPQMQNYNTMWNYFNYQLVNKHWCNMLRNEVVKHSEFYLNITTKRTNANILKFAKVKILDLSFCYISNINFLCLREIKRLNISYSKVDGAAFYLLDKLEYLNIRSCCYIAIQDIMRLPLLKVLNFDIFSVFLNHAIGLYQRGVKIIGALDDWQTVDLDKVKSDPVVIRRMNEM